MSYINNIISPNDEKAIQESNKRFWRFTKHKTQDTQGGVPIKSNSKLENDNKKETTNSNQFSQSHHNYPWNSSTNKP